MIYNRVITFVLADNKCVFVIELQNRVRALAVQDMI